MSSTPRFIHLRTHSEYSLLEGALRLKKLPQMCVDAGMPAEKSSMLAEIVHSQTKGNAFFSGFGKRKRVVLFDTLIEKHSEEELVAVLAHEVGHYKKKHITKNYDFKKLAFIAHLFE